MALQSKLGISEIGFQDIKLFKDQTLGIGSYGKVCRARCDNLDCAAKLLHETLFDFNAEQFKVSHRSEHRLPLKRFEKECEFLNLIKHPNIIQYLGMYQDPSSGLGVLLMELMDCSLTNYLETSQYIQSVGVPFHIQVNICHDITLALSFLHSNGILHRDLSGNNVLLSVQSNIRAKVTDFGMASLSDQLSPQPRQTSYLTYTMCPGTDPYMPPEAVTDKPTYSNKIDCFSFGVIVVQILTRKFPKPSDRLKQVEINRLQSPNITAFVPISERERRQKHIREA
ncbi:MAG: protein kinase, partial [Proteobacteria bacterium]|nr:protein kinase [Pseudomonadota bacterium]